MRLYLHVYTQQSLPRVWVFTLLWVSKPLHVPLKSLTHSTLTYGLFLYQRIIHEPLIHHPSKPHVNPTKDTLITLASLLAHTIKKLSCPSIFFPAFLQTSVIDKPVPALFENASIRNPITMAQNQRFTKRCHRRPIAAFFKNAGTKSPKVLG